MAEPVRLSKLMSERGLCSRREADEYIEKFAYDFKKDYEIVVATNDALQQVILRSAGCALLSARELKEELEAARERLETTYKNRRRLGRAALEEGLPEEIRERMEEIRQNAGRKKQ